MVEPETEPVGLTEAQLAEIEAVVADHHSPLPLALHDGFEDEEYDDGSGGWVTEHHRYYALRARCQTDDPMTPGSHEAGRFHDDGTGRQIATLANAVPALVAEVRRLRAALRQIEETPAPSQEIGTAPACERGKETEDG